MIKKIMFLVLIFSLLLAACSAARAATAQPNVLVVENMSTAEALQSLSKNVSQQTQPVEQSQPVQQALDGQQAQPGQAPNGHMPPKEAFDSCVGKTETQACEFTAAKGLESGVCALTLNPESQNQLACTPQRGPEGGGNSPDANQQGQAQANNGQQGAGPQGGKQQPGTQQGGGQGGPQVDVNGSAYNIEQAISDKAQGMTIAYDALAFMTGDLGSDSFFPPGKVADFWGFQYLRDNDPSQMGHAGDFLTSAAMNTLNNLTTEQRAELVALAKSQVASINDYGYKRFVLIKAFTRLLDGELPGGTTGLSADAVKAYSSELYRLDGEISFARAELYGRLINSFTADQKAYFDNMKGKGMKTWPSVTEPEDIRGLDRDSKVAVMTYAADMYSWYAGSVEADVYFCPERHGTYFGSFYLKDIKAMSDPTYSIPTNLTGDLGQTMLDKLTPDQAQLITSLVTTGKPPLLGLVEVRTQISTELRKFLAGGAADKASILSLSEKYGAFDGEIIYNMAVNFTKVSQSLSADQKAQLVSLRTELLGDLAHPSGAYLYSQPISMPEIQNTDFLFK